MARFSDADSPSEVGGARFGGTGLGIPSPIPTGPKTGSLFAKRDPGQMTLMALMQRQKELAARMGEGQQPVASWTQGLSNALNQTYQGFQEGRNDRRINEGNQIQAQALAGADPKTGLLPEGAIDSLTAVNPELAYKALQDIAGAAERDRQFQLEKEKIAATLGATGAWKPSDIGSLRDDYTKAAGIYDNAMPSWISMQDAANSAIGKTGPGVGSADLNLVVGLAKILDPISVVREGESESVKKTGGAADYLVSYYNQLVGGGTLTDDIRKGIMSTGQSRMKAYYDQASSKRKWVSDIAARHSVNPDDVVPPLAGFVEWTPPEVDDVRSLNIIKPRGQDIDTPAGSPEGTIGDASDGSVVIVKDGKWVPLRAGNGERG